MNKTFQKIGPTDKDIHVDMLFFRGVEDTPEARQKRRDALKLAKPILDILKEHLESSYNSAASVRVSDYAKGDWAALQAHRNGEMEAYEKIWKVLP